MEYTPPVLEVMDQAADDGPIKTDCHIGPAHPRALGAIQLVGLPVIDVGKVSDAGVVHVLTREDGSVKVPGMGVGNGMA